MQRSLVRAAAVAVALLSAASVWASGRKEATTTPASPAPWQGPGMMGRGRGYGPGTEPGYGPGTEPGYAPGIGGMRGRMMGGAWAPHAELPLLDKPLTLDGAADRAKAALTEWGYTDFVLDEVIQYSTNYYVLVKEKSTGKGAAELLVDARTGAVGSEPGPAMMWNTKYGHMRWSGTTAAPSLSADDAKKAAKTWLEQNGDTTAWELELTEMYGYYTIHLVRDGRTEGMLGVNASTGQVWFHTWHGPFVASKQIEG